MAKGNWIPVRGAQGEHSRQAHADLPDGTYEREVSKEGFFGPAAFLYHRRPPTGWVSFEGPLRPRAFDLNGLNQPADSPWDAPVVLHNGATEIRFWKLAGPMTALARNADGDQLLFVHTGQGDLFCDYGRIAFKAGDYLYLPRGTMWRLAPDGPAAILTIQATNGHYTLPDRGLLGPHAQFDPAMLDTPVMDEAFRDHQAQEGMFPVRIKKRGAVSVATYPYNPLDAVGWHGELAPVRLNVSAIRPVVSHRYHLPPSAHTTFVADRFVVCTFTPRPFETDPGAIKVPFFHNNDDFDEVLFYHAGDFFSRDNIDAGMMTFHPSGFTHGPHPKALKNMLVQTKEATDEIAVMIDTRDPLEVGDGAAAVENTAYVDSWKTP
ncbi:homogentisate 1,2-dioxygenase [Caulobacter ginsengisoli]|uniref:Homogentisate 1,2-dioxygenase n=1 Tax=Caulobacter ginsengisoli TaxID=400775 RepID=A0ABU0IV13_9CAUL|nr:homogentisate 1,2-dioxygenase [Caulobacter ginsengisoli]MDQ0465844.1 homogentisate 1,2-dioxygenase [Caulobacter ginsengisoli]